MDLDKARELANQVQAMHTDSMPPVLLAACLVVVELGEVAQSLRQFRARSIAGMDADPAELRALIQALYDRLQASEIELQMTKEKLNEYATKYGPLGE